MKVPIFVGNITIVTEFAVVENMDAYRDKEIGDVIVGKPICKEINIDAKRFERKITLQSGNNNITYMMPRDHPRLKHATNMYCYKFSPFLYVDDKDEHNGIKYPYQKMKGFYEGVLKLGPEYVHDELVRKYIMKWHLDVDDAK